MALDTPKTLRSKVIYEVFVRNHGKNGTFQDVAEDLDRIKALGTDIVWFMPIHPIGEVNKKGSLGCPYSIKDYQGINPEYGTEDDFRALVDGIHAKGMLVMIDVVYNHTSHDAVYTQEHDDFYYRKNGKFGNKIADWADIIDLDYGNRDLWQAQIDALVKWAAMGVDGFRCDVAPFVPMEFWMEARRAVQAINPEVIWLAETVHPHFLEAVRDAGFYCASDCETFEAFDICYDYDTHPEFTSYFRGDGTLEDLLKHKRMQESIYPENYVKLRFLENHDNMRAHAVIPNLEQLKTWTAFLFFEKGATLIYAGQEALETHQPDLFDVDKINWSGLEAGFSDYIARLAAIKKHKIFEEGIYKIHYTEKKGVIYASYKYKDQQLLGVFNVGNKIGELDLTQRDMFGNGPKVPDGVYENQIDGSTIVVKDGKLDLENKGYIFRI
ncbi:MAG: alpha-amylase family glycosyl hydrolase [Clostridia bacterium]|nr:alpha-amylase family glycosyl hydrolase [Clostridia bacterium]